MKRHAWLRSSNSHQLPRRDPAFFDRHPGDAGRRAAIGSRDATRIEKTNSVDRLIARHVRVSVQDHIRLPRWTRGRNVNEMKTNSVAFEVEGQWPTPTVVVAEYDVQRRPELLELHQCRRIANIAEVPNFIRVFQSFGQARWKAIGCVRDDGDPHE